MNKYSILALGLVTILLTACNGGRSSKANEKQAPSREAQDVQASNKFAGLSFATKKDTSCGMPLSAGVEVTVQHSGKVYGFCSSEFKSDFVTLLQKQHKR